MCQKIKLKLSLPVSLSLALIEERSHSFTPLPFFSILSKHRFSASSSLRLSQLLQFCI
ncbi:hypothetical protein AHAS_Ahas13G0334200 [Arachis hypogaea]